MSSLDPPIAMPLSDEQMLKLAARSMFDVFAGTAMGMMLVDRQHRIVWISDSYQQFLPALGFERAEQFVGRLIEDVVPNSLMGKVIDSGQPILVDLLSNPAGTFLVSRLPLRNEAGEVSAPSAWCCSTSPRRRCNR
jgi:transcriptional regulator with PAS, ATPase and Fis domain